MLALPEPHKLLVVYSYASRLGLGCVLIHDGRVVAFTTQQLKDHEKNYPTHYLDLVVESFP